MILRGIKLFLFLFGESDYFFFFVTKCRSISISYILLMSLQILMNARPPLYAVETNIQAAWTQMEVMNVFVQEDTTTPIAQIKPVLEV